MNSHWCTRDYVNERVEAMEELNAILESYRGTIGDHFDGYANHCRRVFLFTFYLMPQAPYGSSEEMKALMRKVAISLAFHDIGLWTARTIDYLDPSRILALEYLDTKGLGEWKQEVGEIIDRHHQILQGDLPTESLTNIVRLADLADFSWGFVRGSLPVEVIREVQGTYPNKGFHAALMGFVGGRMVTKPWSPAPMMRLY